MKKPSETFNQRINRTGKKVPNFYFVESQAPDGTIRMVRVTIPE